MTHNARVSSRLPTPEVDELPRLWLWLEGTVDACSLLRSIRFPDFYPHAVLI